MPFIELNRSFVPVSKDKEPVLDAGIWGRKYLGWLGWPDLLKRRRVVLLAEALSGKSEEFRGQQSQLQSQGKVAFFVRIEELADQSFEAALDPQEVKQFETWMKGSDEAYFFLDSIDEARLNQKSFDTALKRFAGVLGDSSPRARVFISCRVTDWKGEKDRTLVDRILPSREIPSLTEEAGEDDPLLDPIFNKDSKNQTEKQKKIEAVPNELLVVQLVALDSDQCRLLAQSCEVSDLDAFMHGIQEGNFDAYTERPGDVIDLAVYWKSHGRFGRLEEMVEYNISRKLSEEDAHRSDNDILSAADARFGAERIAPALTFTKTFTLRAPGYDPDPSLASGALDASLILNDWNDAKQNALLRRGIFAPATYGRIRFHHRTTQEYLTATWLDRLIQSNCPKQEIWNLVFGERYGIATVLPSLRPTAAWLALKHPDFLNEIVRRDPLILVRNGAPRSLSLDAKKRILLAYAKMHAESEISDDGLDNRAIAQFADAELAETIKTAWRLNNRSDFRMDLLRIIREGKIAACAGLARAASLEKSDRDYNKMVAVQALSACGDNKGLAAAAKWLMNKRSVMSNRVAAEFSKALFPKHLSVKQVLTLVDKKPSSDQGYDGFDYSVRELYDSCDDARMRAEFVSGLAELCLSKPFADSWKRVSKRHRHLARKIESIAVSEVQSLGGAGAPSHVVRLLMVVERAEEHLSNDDGPPLRGLVAQNMDLRRALFWADLEEVRTNKHGDSSNPIRFWQVYIHGPTLWSFGPSDLAWMFEEMESRAREEDRRILLSAIHRIIEDHALRSELAGLKRKVSSDSVLKSDLDAFLAPPVVDEATKKHLLWMKKHKVERDEQKKKDKKSWRSLRVKLRARPAQLCEKSSLQSWKNGIFRLYYLTRWLRHRTGNEDRNAALQWRLLTEGFGKEVAEAYRDGMKMLWRATKPERPKRVEGGAITVKHTTILAHNAVGLEVAEDPQWTSKLSNKDAKTAIGHACLAEQGVPVWLEELIDSHPQFAIPAIKTEITREWNAEGPGQSDFLYYCGRQSYFLRPSIQKILFAIVTSDEPKDQSKMDVGLRVVAKLALESSQNTLLKKLARSRIVRHEKQGNVERALRYIALLLSISSDEALKDLERWLSRPTRKFRKARAEQTFAFLFDRHDPIIPNVFINMSVLSLEQLLRLVYKYIRPEDDAVHEGSYSPDTRDHAENARNWVLTAIIERPGPDAYRVLTRVASDPEYRSRRSRFLELALGKAERDSEPPAWTDQEVVAFEKTHSSPVKTGEDLLRVVMATLSDIQFQMDKADASSRALLQKAQDEDEVRNYVVEQMQGRSRGRFHAYREAQVADKDRPDVIVASASAQCEVGIEVKHGGKSWTKRQLDNALKVQLAEDYLKPATRRHGVFIMSKHGSRRWKDTDTKQFLTFEMLMGSLCAQASSINSNSSGSISIRCVALDASTCSRSKK